VHDLAHAGAARGISKPHVPITLTDASNCGSATRVPHIDLRGQVETPLRAMLVEDRLQIGADDIGLDEGELGIADQMLEVGSRPEA